MHHPTILFPFLIEWHNDTFNEVILVDEREPVKWVIGFTIHRYSNLEYELKIMSTFIHVTCKQMNKIEMEDTAMLTINRSFALL